MALTPRLDLRQSQSLVMTPQLQQAIKLLQFSNSELTEYVESELERNPLLEREDGERSAEAEVVSRDNLSAYETARDGEATPVEDGNGWDDAPAAPDSADLASLENLPGHNEDPNDTDYENNYASAGIEETDGAAAGSDLMDGYQGDWGGGGGGSFESEDGFSFEQNMTAEKTLREHLLEQVGFDIPDPAERMIAVHLTEGLDDAGYFIGDIDDIAENLGCSVEQMDGVMTRVQRFDPAGVYARDLAECLKLQLIDRDRFDPAIEAMLNNLALLAKRDLAGLIRVCGVDAEDLAEMVDEIRSLAPKPGLAFQPTRDQTVVPDVIVRPAADASWIIELNPDTLPRVLVSNVYQARVSKARQSKEDREYIAECHQSANWLVRSLHQRANTIIKVSSEIVLQQDMFFRHGVQYLRPLVLRDIAEAISMHESTISRVTTNKYMTTPRGIFELKYFFSASIASAAGGDAHSAEAVRHRIKALIEAEAPKAILSDDKIVDILRGDGVDIARRTVAKYREALRIPSSVQRRWQKSPGL